VLETLIAVAILLFFLGVAFLNAFLSWETLVTVGAALTALGLVLGLPGGFLYHVKLRRELLTVGALPARWWLHPTDHHKALRPEQLRRFQPAFFVGGIGFIIIMLGALLTFLSVFK
jgi:hypothetical protein